MKTSPLIVGIMAAVAVAQGHARLSAAEALSVAAGDRGAVEIRGPLGCLPAQTRLLGCKPDGAPEVKSVANSVQVRHRTKGPAGQRCSVVETFTTTPTGVRWEVQVESDGEFWTTPIVAAVRVPSPERRRFWSAWLSDAQDVLSPRPFGKASWPFGRFGMPSGLIVIPIATVLDGDRDSGMSWVVSPNNSLLEAQLSMDADGNVEFAFEKHRLGKGRPVRLAMDLTPHEADWRGGLRWMVRRYPDYFDPPNAEVHKMAGSGCYSGAYEDVDYEKLKKMGFSVRWEAAFDWPHYGIFVPPVGDDQTWISEGYYSKAHPASFKLMNERARKMHAHGLWHLNYFGFSEFATNFKLSPVNRELPEKDLWKDRTSFAVRKMSDSMWRDPQGNPSCAGVGDSLAMDPASPSWRAHLIEQAGRYLEKTPESDGLAIDRMWWSYPVPLQSRPVNFGADDGAGWYEGRPGRHFSVSLRSIMADLGRVMHARGKVLFYNPFTAYRLDCYRHVDGFFDENVGGHVGSGLLALRKPAIVWAESSDAVRKDPGFFDRHLLLGVFPMTPFPANDHSIRPDPAVDAAYLDYAPLWIAMRGKKWVLEPHCVEVEAAKARANLFEVPSGWVAPVVFGPKEGAVKLLIRNVTGIHDKLRIDALLPGAKQPQPLTPALKGGVLELRVPLARGCAVVRLAR